MNTNFERIIKKNGKFKQDWLDEQEEKRNKEKGRRNERRTRYTEKHITD